MLLLRTSQHVEFVHRQDPAFQAEGARPAPDPDWVLADGQPPDATRVRVRPLAPHEYQQVGEAKGRESERLAVGFGLVAVDGAPPPPVDELAFGWPQQISNLVIEVTQRPLAGWLERSRTSKADPSPDSPAGSSSPSSP